MPHHHHHAPSGCTRRLLFSTLTPGPMLAQTAGDVAARFRQMSADAERKGLADPFKGITATGAVEPGLFPVHSTGVPTTAVRNAAERFLATLTAAQRDRP